MKYFRNILEKLMKYPQNILKKLMKYPQNILKKLMKHPQNIMRNPFKNLKKNGRKNPSRAPHNPQESRKMWLFDYTSYQSRCIFIHLAPLDNDSFTISLDPIINDSITQ